MAWTQDFGKSELDKLYGPLPYRFLGYDLRGQKLNRFTVIGFHSIDSNSKQPKWLCKCVCGNEKIISTCSLRSGNTKSCGCLRKEIIRKDMTGQKIGKWTVTNESKIVNNHFLWLCKCECGNEKYVNGTNLRKGRSKSCGCFNYRFDTLHDLNGMRNTKEYRAYCGAKGRCNNVNSKHYSSYGGRGIEFKFSSFKEFFAVVGPCPFANFSLDRIDNNGNYEAGNVRWASKIVQANNRRKKISNKELDEKKKELEFAMQRILFLEQQIGELAK